MIHSINNSNNNSNSKILYLLVIKFSDKLLLSKEITPIKRLLIQIIGKSFIKKANKNSQVTIIKGITKPTISIREIIAVIVIDMSRMRTQWSWAVEDRIIIMLKEEEEEHLIKLQ